MSVLAYMVDAFAAASLWADDAVSTPASDGGVVAAWSPNAASAITTNLIQTTNNKRPLYRASYGGSGYPAVETDGVNDELQCAHSASFAASVYDIFLVATPVAVGTGDRLIFAKLTNSSWNDGVSMSHTGTTLMSGAPSYSELSAANALTNGLRTLIYAKLKVSDRTIFSVRDNLVIPVRSTAATSVSATSTAAFCLGGSTPAGGYFANIAYHELRIYTGEMSLSDRLSVFSTLASKWGLTTASGTSAPRMVNVRGGADQ